MKFWDSSAIIPLCITEPRTKTVEDIAKEDNAIIVWWGSTVECHSAFSRLQRDGILKPEENEDLREILVSLSGVWTEIEPCEDIRDIAIRLLMSHPLRAADALQLAAAIVWADKKPKGHHFVCFDIRMREASRKEGFGVLPASI
ncbi:MAG: type II toxin-antitoxin system VapC family toxin [Deltaproteobacteria bacterium]|nr:type II toxin-antitoxin system VapC family toxin [Deltaproteobacteria bacterium]MCL5792429.1 type II toxin-antitoxin system VapC family toxin [Deltaproteobacteria bacterium]